MKRLTREEVHAERLVRSARSIAVLGASSEHGASTGAVVDYLKRAGFDVFPVRADRAEVAGLGSWMSLVDVPGPVDIVLFLDGAIDRLVIEQAARKRARAVWFAPGVVTQEQARRDAEVLATEHDLQLVCGRDIVAEHRHTEQVAGQPAKRGVNAGGRKRQYEDDRKRTDETGYVVGGGGGHKGGGGKHSVLDEKKMVGGKPSPRRGRLHRSGDPP